MFGKSELRKGLEKWTTQGGDLDHALPARGDSPVKTKSEARAICAALDTYRSEPNRGDQIFGEATADLSPEALYGLQSCWELDVNDDSEAPDERSAEKGIEILLEYGNDFEGPINGNY